jgi:hypothetical protein
VHEHAGGAPAVAGRLVSTLRVQNVCPNANPN